MAGTITASMAGELARKVISPTSKSNKDTDEKFNKLKEKMDDLSDRLNPKSAEFIKERDMLVDSFKYNIGFDEFPIKDQKVIINRINEETGANYNILASIQKDLNSSSSLLYRTISKNINNVITAPSKAITFSKSTIDQLSEMIKNKVQNIVVIKSISNSFANVTVTIQKNQSKIIEKMNRLAEKTSAFSERLKNVNGMMKLFASPMKLVSSMFTVLSEISSTIFRVILPTIISMAMTFFTVVLPTILIIVAVVVLLLIILYLLWKHFGKYFQKIWGYIKEYVVDVIVLMWKNLKEIVSWVWDTLQLAWGIITDIYDFVDCIFSGDFVGAGKIIVRLMDRIVDYVSKTFEHIFNIFGNFGDFLSKLPIIGPVFKFLFGVLMPFMRFFIEAFNWIYSFIKGVISVAWDNLVDSFKLIKAIFSGDFSGAGIIVERIFTRITTFLFEKVISALIIFKKLGDSLLKSVDIVFDMAESIFNIFGNFGDFLSKLPIIGPIFKFMFGVLMPFMRFYIDTYKVLFGFFKGSIMVAWNTLVDSIGLIKAIFSGDFSGAKVIMDKIVGRIQDFIIKSFENIFNIFKNLGESLSKLPIIGPVFKFLLDVFMPFLPFLISSTKWLFSFIKDGVSIVWDNLVDTIKLIKAIFSGDFKGAGIIIKSMFDRVKNFLLDKVISLLIIFQKLGESMLVPIKWLWDKFKPIWNYIYKKVETVLGWIWNIFKLELDIIMKVINWIWTGLKVVADWIWSGFKLELDIIMKVINWIWTELKVVADWIWTGLKVVVNWIWDAFKSGWDTIVSIVMKIWDFITNPGKLIAAAATKIKEVVAESFSAVTDTLSDWGSSVVDTINPMNWFAKGKIALEPMKAVFAEAGPEAAIPLDDEGLSFLKKTFNIDDNSFNAAINNSELYKCIMDIKDQNICIKDQNIGIKEVVDEISVKISDMERPSFYESVTQSYSSMFTGSSTTSEKTNKKESAGDIILKKLEEIEKLLKNIQVNENTSPQAVFDTEMNLAKLISSGILGRR